MLVAHYPSAVLVLHDGGFVTRLNSTMTGGRTTRPGSCILRWFGCIGGTDIDSEKAAKQRHTEYAFFHWTSVRLYPARAPDVNGGARPRQNVTTLFYIQASSPIMTPRPKNRRQQAKGMAI